uniref:Oxaloacetate tautomerase FAHD1, mitochondrial n=1 Tax=Leptobrachium leishanense TaxID=445787 RepID=A0A8C5QNR2_9ANUR
GRRASAVFPVHRIYCIGRNYAAHAREMGSDPTREPPFFFQKPNDAIQYVAPGQIADHPYPALTRNYHYEVELVAALQHVFGYAVGLDMTRRDLQGDMKDQKKPWEIGKSFDLSAPIGPIHRVARTGPFPRAWRTDRQALRSLRAQGGDLIYSGTPENVGAVVRGT